MSQASSKKSSTLAAVAGTGLAAGLVALQNADAASGSASAAVADATMDNVQASAADAPMVESQASASADSVHIDDLVQAYLGEGSSDSLSTEALVADVPDTHLEPELLQALASGAGVDIAQAGGGFAGFLSGVGGGSTLTGALLVGGGLIGGGLLINEATKGT